MSMRRVVVRGVGSGVVAGLLLVALMYLAKLVIGTTPLPQLLQQPILAVMPGFVFGFLIDTLQHAGKVVEEAGLVVGMIVGLGSRWSVGLGEEGLGSATPGARVRCRRLGDCRPCPASDIRGRLPWTQ